MSNPNSAGGAAARVATSPGDEKFRADQARAAKLYGDTSSGGLTPSRARTLTASIFDPREFEARYCGDKDRAAQLGRERLALEDWLIKKNATELQVSRLVSNVSPHIAAMERQAQAIVPSDPRSRANYDSAQQSLSASLAAQPARTMEQLRARHGDGLSPLVARAQANTAEIVRVAPLIGAVLAFSSAANNADVIESIASIGS